MKNLIEINFIWSFDLKQIFSNSLSKFMNEIFLVIEKTFQSIGLWRCPISSPQGHRTVASLWEESGLNWTDLLPEEEDVKAFISQQVSDEGQHSSRPKKYQ